MENTKTFLDFYLDNYDSKDVSTIQLEAIVRKEIAKELRNEYKNYKYILSEEDDDEDDDNASQEEKKKEKKEALIKKAELKFDEFNKKLNELKAGNQEFRMKYPRLSRLIRYGITAVILILGWHIAGGFAVGKLAALVIKATYLLGATVAAVIVNKKINENQVTNIVNFYNTNAEYLDKKIEDADNEEEKAELKSLKGALEKNARNISGRYYSVYKVHIGKD